MGTWRCPDCGWAHSYDEPMTDVYCVDCFRQGRGKDHRCERMVPAADHRGAVRLTPNEAALLEVLAREEVAKHEHPPHDLVRARDKLRAHAERGQ